MVWTKLLTLFEHLKGQSMPCKC